MLASIIRLEREVANVARVAGGRTAMRYAAAIAGALPQIIRSGTLTAADEAMHGRDDLLLVHVDGVRLMLPARCFAGMREMYARRVYVRPSGFQIRPGNTVIDLGCNQGLFTLFAAKIGASVIAVDAQAGFRESLSEHLKRNGCAERVTFVPALVGASAGLFADADVLSAGSHYTGLPKTVEVEELVADFDRVDFLKVDIEGAEFRIFCDDQPWISKVDKIAMEVHPEFGEPQRIIDWLSDAGFGVSTTNDGYIYAARRGAHE
jgi:FkbM family methyltransferase